MDRVLEPEIMDDRDAARAYARADFSDSNQAFVDDWLARFGDAPTHVLDLGTGPADVPLRLARALPSVRVTAVDGSPAMLELARRAVRKSRLGPRIELLLARMPGLALPQHAFDAVICKDMLHHLPDPQVLWSEIKRLARPGAAVYVMDLIRPSSPLEAREIVERVAAAEHPLLKEDFYRSLLAAFTPEELRAQVEAAGLGLAVARAGDRHMIAAGRLPGRGAPATSR
jgi:ubiquinone/menaquinone biosynthesis C-methylase UbiE